MQGQQILTLREVVVLLLLASVLPLSSCADEEGQDPYAMWAVYQHQRELYHFRYLNPPWVFVKELEEEHRQLIAIDPRLERINYHLERRNLHARIKLTVEMYNRRDPESLANADIHRYREMALAFHGPEPFMSRRGFIGFKTSATLSDRHIVTIYHAVGNRGTVVLKAAASESLDTADMTLLMKSLEPEALDGD